MSERQNLNPDTIKAINALLGAKHSEVITDEEELGRFRRFLLTRGIPNKAYVLAYQMPDGGYMWFRYLIEGVEKFGRHRLAIRAKQPTVFLPADHSEQYIPEPFQDLPVWYLKRKQEDE